MAATDGLMAPRFNARRAAAGACTAALLLSALLVLRLSGSLLSSSSLLWRWPSAPRQPATARLKRRIPPSPPPPPPSRPPPLPCVFSGLLNNSDVRWSLRQGVAHRLSIRGCALRRFTHAQARRCLAGKRLVFVGDSVTRYQYLTLIYFLEKGRWPAPLGGVPGEPSVANEHEWPSWNDFLQGTAALFGGRELCDCYRAHYVLGKTAKPPESEKFENRFYVTPDGNTSASHFTYTTEPHTVHGHLGFPPFVAGRQPCAPATCSAPLDWQYNLAGALRRVVLPLQPTHLIVNSGLWGSSNSFGDERLRDIAAAGRDAVAAQGGRVIWRTTTAELSRPAATRDHDNLALKHTAAKGWGVLDGYAITRPLLDMQPRPMWDPRHFQALVYRELNLVLLNMICQQEG